MSGDSTKYFPYHQAFQEMLKQSIPVNQMPGLAWNFQKVSDFDRHLMRLNFLGSLPKTDFKTNQQNKKPLDVKVPMLKRNKSELTTNKTLITQVTNALFNKVDQKRLQLVGCISVLMKKLTH